MPLSMVKTGETQTVRKVNGKDDTKKFLETLGIIKGEQLTVLSETGGNVIINVKDSRIALSKSMATRIIV
ncbi:MAG: ferrous iron transport protein A [Clostridiales bacterium]|nr:ferrous iron transport protein A [Clostridiales bacterium]